MRCRAVLKQHCGERMEEMSKRLDEENLRSVWERVFLLIRKITGNVDVANKGTLQDQISSHVDDTKNPHRVTAKQLGLDKVENVAVSDQKPEFQTASVRENIKSGEKLSVSFGKIRKWFSDLKGGAFASVANNLTTTEEGSVLDARQGKKLHDLIEEQNNNLTALNNLDNVIRYPDMSSVVHTQSWAQTFSWEATEDCWIFAVGATEYGEVSAQVKLNSTAVLSVLDANTNKTTQGFAFFPCKKGDIISKTKNGNTVALFYAYSMKKY